jgi:hypothetical protein
MQAPDTSSLLAQPQVLAGLITAGGTILGALIVGIAGTIISRRYTRARDLQDRESQWRSHAIELTKLEIQRKLACRSADDPRPRPAILDFLANYRDLQELGSKTPRELYETIETNRISDTREKPDTLVAKKTKNV